MPRVPILAGVLLSAALISCGQDDGAPASASITTRDSAGVTIVEHGETFEVADLLANQHPVLQIGMVDGPEALQLFRVYDAKRMMDGAFAVANGGTREVRIYEADGRHRVTVGGRGDGPREFRLPRALLVRGDTLVVQDTFDRVSFLADGTFVGRTTTSRQDLAAVAVPHGTRLSGGTWLADGTFLATLSEVDPNPGSALPGDPFRPPMTFARVPGDLVGLDTLGTFGGLLQQWVDIGRESAWIVVPPFAANTTRAVGAHDARLVAADNAVPQIEIFHGDGRLVISRWSAPAEPVGSNEIEPWKERQRKASWTEGQRPVLELAWAVMEIPDEKPFYGEAKVGSDGRTWLGPVEPEGRGWMVVGADGQIEGRVDLPGAFVPMDSGPGWVLGLFRDVQEVEFLRLYELFTG